MTYYIWAGEDCDNTAKTIEEAQETARWLVEDRGHPDAYVLDESGVKVFDYAKARTQFEVTCAGFNGGDDNTDDRVLWVLASCEEEIAEAVAGTGVVSIVPMHSCVDEPYTDDPSDIDYVLPKATLELTQRCKHFLDTPVLAQ